jgi:2'-5' RNA ligase
VEEQKPTSIVIIVKEASFLQSFREEHLQRPGVTIPPHITVRSPFMPSAAIDEQVRHRLRGICAPFASLTFTLGQIDRFQDPGVLYLVREPSESFYYLSEAIQEEFSLEAVGRPVYHLTLAGWHPSELDRIELKFHLRYANQLPISAQATVISLYEQVG